MISFSARLARRDFDLDVAFEGDTGVTALFGPSGCGKTTVIRILAGLERPAHGRIVLGGTVLLDTEGGIRLPPHRRRIGLVFQDGQLFSHLSVAANLAYGRFFTPKDRRRVDREAVIEVLGIGHLLDRAPSNLSGGEKQRVAIGRALLTSPELLLMDEPLAALDDDRKLEILPFVERLRDEFGIPIVYVSHAVEEVARLAQKVVRLDKGRVSAVGTPAEVLAPTAIAAHATERFDALSVVSGRVAEVKQDYSVSIVDHPAGEIVLPGFLPRPGSSVRVAIRATDVTLAMGHTEHLSVRTKLAGRVVRVETDDGPFALVTLELIGGDRLYAYATRLAVERLGLDVDDRVSALIKAVSIDERGVPGLRVVTS